MASSLFLINNLRISGLDYVDEPFHGTYVGAFVDEKLCAVIAQFWNGVLIPQAPVHLQALLELLLKSSETSPKGFVGPLDQVTALIDHLELVEFDFQVDGPEKLYQCDLAKLIVPSQLGAGNVIGRLALPVDSELMSQWRVEYSIEALNEIETPELIRDSQSSIENLIQEKRLWLLEHGEQPVACSAFNASIDEAVQIGGVYTPPEFRGKGYGRSVVAHSLAKAREMGVSQSILFTEEDNIPAQKAYEAIGFEQIGQFRLSMLKC